MLAKLFELLRHLSQSLRSASPGGPAQNPRLIDASSAGRLVAPTHSQLRAAWCMDISALVCAAWRGFLILPSRGQLASAARSLHSQLAPDLSSIGRQFDDEAEARVLRSWSRVIGDGDESQSDSD